MEWIKKNKVLVSVVGVGLVIVAVIISVMLLMPKADRSDSDDDLTGDMPENLILEKGLGDDAVANDVKTNSIEIDWSDSLSEDLSGQRYDLILKGLQSTVYDESVYDLSTVLTASFDYVVMNFDYVPKIEDVSDMPSVVVMSENFSTTAANGSPAFYIEQKDESGDISWNYLDPSKGFVFEKGQSYRVLGVLKMSDGTDDEKAEMLSGFSFSVFDSHDNTDFLLTVKQSEVEIQMNEAQSLAAGYIDRALTCFPSGLFTDEVDETIEVTRFACLLAEQDGVDLGFEWNDPNHYGDLYGDLSDLDWEKYEIYTLENWPEGCYDRATGEVTDKYKQLFKQANGIEYDDYLKQQEETAQKLINDASASGTE